ncbi:MAG: hypothetical protein FIA99_17985 [Ruminiclostridium sp.]|nr:hypothetical protein [Ruminiclostridium sp.]
MKGGMNMLGIPDASIWLAYILCILSAGACIVYGLINWNKGSENEQIHIQEEVKWEDADKA